MTFELSFVSFQTLIVSFDLSFTHVLAVICVGLVELAV